MAAVSRRLKALCLPSGTPAPHQKFRKISPDGSTIGTIATGVAHEFTTS